MRNHMQFFNGIPDWNGNGRSDPGDLAMDYMIFRSIFNEDNESDNDDSDEDEDDFYGRSGYRR